MINLLPPKQKEFLASEKKKRLILILGIVFLIFFISLTLVFLSVGFYISGQSEARIIVLEQKQKEFQGTKISALEQEITLANDTVLELNSFYQERASLIKIFEQISELLPQDAYLHSFACQDQEIQLAGFAPTRASLLQLRQSLIDQEEFSDVSFPGEPWIYASNIDFVVSFRIGSVPEQ